MQNSCEFFSRLANGLSTAWLTATVLLVPGCHSTKPPAGQSGSAVSDTTAADTAHRAGLQRLTINGISLYVETAQTDDERQRGLMFRETLPPDEGMLFVFPVAQIQSFWMRNTFIPLDIAFIAEDGAIIDIQHMKPVDESVLYTSTGPALYALEVNAGWFAQHRIEAGTRVNF